MRAVLRLSLLLSIGLGLASPLRALELYPAGLTWLDVSGDAKSFFFASYPYDSELLSPDPSAQGAVDFRLKWRGGIGSWLSFDLHHNLSLASQSGLGLALGGSAVNSTQQAQAIDLDWNLGSGASYTGTLRVDRAMLRLRLPAMDISVGRQPISFGSTFFFSPMDLIATFSPTVVDREYKPGIDAIRSDSYFGSGGQLSLVAAYGGAWNIEQSILAARLATSLNNIAVGLLAAQVYSDWVIGLDATGDIIGISLRSEITATLPKQGQPFTRAVLGADTTIGDFSLMGEVYLQTLGASQAKDYLTVASSERFSRGELWAMGQYYAALSLSYALAPILNLSTFALINLGDPSALLSPSLAWSISDEADLIVGGYFGLGERPELKDPWIPTPVTGPNYNPASLDPSSLIQLNSEFGLLPSTLFVELKAYF